jgi:hypothetical protein
VQDPADGLKRIGRKLWEQRWHDRGAEGEEYRRWGAVIGGPDNPKGSYFADCPRDDQGHCEGSGGAGTISNDKPKTQRKPRVPEQKPSAKAQRAKAAHVMVDKSVQRYAEERNEPRFAKAVGGESYPDGEPLDIGIKDKKGKVRHGIELKTLVMNGNGKITMDSYAQVRKIVWEQEQAATFHTVVSDDHEVFAGCKDGGECDESKRVYYYRRGVAGSARIGSLHRCKDEAELKQLMAMPEGKLPQAAQRTDGKLRVGKWDPFQDERGKGFRNSDTGQEVRAKK